MSCVLILDVFSDIWLYQGIYNITEELLCYHSKFILATSTKTHLFVPRPIYKKYCRIVFVVDA
jgi:hypothetical protein